jgi:hypothetical protein
MDGAVVMQRFEANGVLVVRRLFAGSEKRFFGPGAVDFTSVKHDKQNRKRVCDECK